MQTGEKIAYLPISVDIEDKIRNLKEKEDTLFRRYPQFTALTKNTKKDYVRNCIKNSLNVNKKLLELGININQPMTKGGTSEAFGNMEDLTNYLTEEMSSSTYREIVIIVYKDGRIVTYQDDANTSTYYQVKLKKLQIQLQATVNIITPRPVKTIVMKLLIWHIRKKWLRSYRFRYGASW